MSDATHHDTPRKPRMSFKTALTPIYWLAGVNAAACWLVSWLFCDRFDFSGTLFGSAASASSSHSAYLYGAGCESRSQK